ncbi:hypothetical protein [uncultured Clostridium sp.]|uniref:hypothetical protein n=1 Tax=uncultured Clostridium sp. TaxID=59620 RepID=UPI0025EE5DCA|nr:hypothetical protein [uncultured Clostridium sp.]
MKIIIYMQNTNTEKNNKGIHYVNEKFGISLDFPAIYIGTYTGITMSETDKNFDLYVKMHCESEDVLKALKSIN